MASAIQSIQSNPIPQGGVAAMQPIAPNQVPASIAVLVQQLMPQIAAFRAASSPLSVPLETMQIAGLGQEADIRLKSVGLGYRVRSYHTVVINIANTNAAAQTVTLSPHFPYNLITNTAIQINGGETTYSASGRAGLMAFARTRPGFFQPQPGAAGLNASWCNMTLSAGGTFTAAAASAYSFSGQASISVGATTNTNLTINFVTFEKLAHGRDTMIGALPLQNNQTFATLTMRPV
ncbi:MAG: hypothetical protein ACRENM_07560, partial [Candidatus Dormibacteraceae bacterium]